MDAATKTFIFMVIFSILVGLIVILANPNFRIPKIYQTNKSYYSAVTSESFKNKSSNIEKK